MDTKFKILLLAWALAGFSFCAHAQTYEKSQTLSRSFHLSEDTRVEVYNKYGNVHLVSWEKDSVRFEATITVTANRQNKVDRTFDNIRLKFDQTGDIIYAATAFESGKGQFWKDVSDFANIIFKGGAQAQINYKVHLPGHLKLRVENKFGNVYASTYQGQFKLLLSNGDLKINKLSDQADINISFGKGSINQLKTANINIEYGDLEIETSDSLEIVSKSSTLMLGKARSVNINSKRDKFFIDEVEKLSGETSFSYINVKKLGSEAYLRTNYGEMNLDQLNPAFNYINLISDYTDVSLSIPRDLSFDVEINYNNKVSLMLPETFDNLRKKTLDPGGESFLVQGTIGKENENNGLIKIAKNAGIINIFYY
ncbi:MAG: hypothetical protein K9G67_08980 [Bacteroidales bacterium]|nr:hypothetical protein [Bacteroidales bacterium]MCF8344562.1 hypothetical protein [Bacteroidales bacterium]MCF8350343.1 hypothetical protein [Bacteroidales bacterium]MCF8376475.1 hypothetical protein [Bacteroidales bacterium]